MRSAASAVVLMVMAVAAASEAAPPSFSSPHDQGCLNQTCGAIRNISYPFTLTRNNASCPSFPSPHSYFQLFCNETTQSLYMLPDPNVYANGRLTTLQVTAILNDSLIVNFTDSIAFMKPSPDDNFSDCSLSDTKSVLLPPAGEGPYLMSDENHVGVFGCSRGILESTDIKGNINGFTTILDYNDHVSVSGCAVLLPDDENNKHCDNGTCCIDSLPPTSDIPTRLVTISVNYTSYTLNQTSPACSCDNNYAAIFHTNYVNFAAKSFGMKIKWALPSPQYFNDMSLLSDRLLNSSDYACSAGNAIAMPVPEIQGYLCSCNPGFVGDGYAKGTGCQNVNECVDPSLNRCVRESTCRDTVGNYTCECSSRYRVGDGRSDGTGCKLSPSIVRTIVSVPSIMGVAFIVIIIVIFLKLWRKRVKQRYFMLNGGLELQEYMKKSEQNTTRIFTKEELNVATNNYADNMKIGMGGFGAVYKGKLEDGKLVAIKKSIKLENGDGGQLFNEITILSKINHKHIVRLLGCCLETKIPLLVYEFVPNGTLAENLNRDDGATTSWEQRLKIALQTSAALAYLHGAASPPILHRDVKSANVLLDENWDVKVADFGVSRLVPIGVNHVSTAVQGTIGYLDPEYFQTLQLSDKSDVYSFGVMLVELITTLKPVDSRHRAPQFSNLALLFIHHMKEGTLDEIIDPRLEIVDHEISPHDDDVDWAWKIRSSILSVASLAYRCLALTGRCRPSMVEVEHELHRISQLLYSRNADLNMVQEESSHLVGAVTIENDSYVVESSHAYSSGMIGRGNDSYVSKLGRRVPYRK